MTTMSRAIKTAGVAIPVNKRCWLWLQEHGTHTGTEVAHALKIKPSVSSSILSQMVARDMLHGDRKLDDRLGRKVFHYTVRGKTFELKPLKKVEKLVSVDDSTKLGQLMLQELLPKKSKVETILDNLSVTEAFEVYTRLKQMFNQKE